MYRLQNVPILCLKRVQNRPHDRMISAQYRTEFIHSEYQNIKKVYSIFICMTPPQKRQNSITRYRLVEENLIGNVKEPVRNYDLLSVVMVCRTALMGKTMTEC